MRRLPDGPSCSHHFTFGHQVALLTAIILIRAIGTIGSSVTRPPFVDTPAVPALKLVLPAYTKGGGHGCCNSAMLHRE